MTEAQKIAHLQRRSGFGPGLRSATYTSLDEAIHQILNGTVKYNALFLPGEEKVTTGELLRMDKEERKEILQDLAANIKRLNLEWLKEMGRAENQLREKMALFWHGHFAVRVRGYAQVESYINTIRKYSLANFGDLLMAVSKEPAMLRFLNNQQNRKNSPNENFARELMELFTLGRGNYTENDIKEAARAFTGWGFNDEDEFELKAHQHDYGSKTIFGKTGNWEGEDVIRMILENPQTAKFICSKIYRFFVSDQVHAERVQALADIFFKSNYDIPSVLKHLFNAPWFYEDEIAGALIKSPVELIVGLNRSLGIAYSNPQPLLAVQRVLGQTLFFPPNVAGWAGGRNWIDNSTLITRLNLPKRLADASELDVAAKFNMDDENPNESEKPRNNVALSCSISWDKLAERFPENKFSLLFENIQSYLIAGNNPVAIPNTLETRCSNLNQVEKVREVVLYLTRTPEFQLA
jgi:uncharacterized protein (DUF1800 family)